MEIVSNLFQLNIKSHWGNSHNLFLNLCLVRSWVKKFFLSISSFLLQFFRLFFTGLPGCLQTDKIDWVPHELVLNTNSGRSWVNSLFMSISYFFLSIHPWTFYWLTMMSLNWLSQLRLIETTRLILNSG